jgi:CDGSH-type Zn-finger protein
MMSDVKIRIRDNGPLLVEGPVSLLDAAGQAFALDPTKPAFALCRCGASARKPFCDGAHKTCGFAAADRAPGK